VELQWKWNFYAASTTTPASKHFSTGIVPLIMTVTIMLTMLHCLDEINSNVQTNLTNGHARVLSFSRSFLFSYSEHQFDK
jgi:hypothetical protein